MSLVALVMFYLNLGEKVAIHLNRKLRKCESPLCGRFEFLRLFPIFNTSNFDTLNNKKVQKRFFHIFDIRRKHSKVPTN